MPESILELSNIAHSTSGEEQEVSTHSVISWKGQEYGEYLKQVKRYWFEAWGRKEAF